MSTLAKEGLGFEPAITFEDVWVGFDEGQVLRGVTFQVQERETLILLGETGTGKTLTLKMAAGLLTPNSGSVIVLGNEISEMSEEELLPFRRKVGFVFQEGALFDSMTVADNVAYRLREDGMAEGEIEPRVREVLRLRDVYGVTALLATHRLQDGFALANFHSDSETKRVVPNGHNGNAAGTANTEDAYLKRFLV